MGLLDDAIREHLELKRRHGASDEEIAQEEAEALGPARRAFPATQEEAAGEEQSAEGQSAEGEGAVEDPFPEAIEDLPTAVERPPAAEPESALEPEPETEAPREPEPEQAFEPEPEPEPETEDPELATDNWELGTEDEQPPEEDEPRKDEDVLEETPEFLQDAPEHDRLWFEQKPPRDFDFE